MSERNGSSWSTGVNARNATEAEAARQRGYGGLSSTTQLRVQLIVQARTTYNFLVPIECKPYKYRFEWRVDYINKQEGL